MKLHLPRIDASKFSKSFLLHKMRSVATDEVWPLLDMIGKARFEKLIDENKSFISLLPVEKMPESWKSAMPKAGQFGFINNVIMDEDWVFMLPDWLAALVNRDNKSKAWFMVEVATIKKLVFGG